MGFPNPMWTGAQTVADLTEQTGWTEVTDIGGYPLDLQIDVGTRLLGASRYVMFTDYSFSELTEVAEVRAVGVVGVSPIGGISDPLIFVTNTPIAGFPNVGPTDSLTASPDSTFPDTTNRWLFAWAVTTPEPLEGPLVISRGSPDFEVSGSQHCWLYPQRANMIANPSFEAPGMDFWSGNGTLTRVPGGAPAVGMVVKGELDDPEDLPTDAAVGDNWVIEGEVWTWNGTKWVNHGEIVGVSAWSGECAGGGDYCIMESNIFPTQMGELDAEQWTVQLMAKGDGKLKVGFVFWDADYRVTACDWGADRDETWTLSPAAWTHVATHRHAPEGHIAMVRLELQGDGPLTIDRVLAERGYLKDWLYFDGDEHYGARDDFSWYGGANRHGATYSLWYNHRKAVTGRLFARTVDPNDPSANVTDEDMEEQGLVYRWVPAGITVVPHLDIFYPFDVQNSLPPKTQGVLPPSSLDNPDGVSDPW